MLVKIVDDVKGCRGDSVHRGIRCHTRVIISSGQVHWARLWPIDRTFQDMRGKQVIDTDAAIGVAQ